MTRMVTSDDDLSSLPTMPGWPTRARRIMPISHQRLPSATREISDNDLGAIASSAFDDL